jgi:hypothetical protein
VQSYIVVLPVVYGWRQLGSEGVVLAATRGHRAAERDV